MRGKLLAVGGDSHSDRISSNGSVTYGHNLPERTWPTLLAARLSEVDGEPWRENNVAKGGATSLRMAQFSDDILYVAKPDITILYCGANDLGAGLTPDDSAAYVGAVAMMAMYDCMGAAIRDAGGHWSNTGRQNPFSFVATAADLPLNGRAGQRYVVLADDDATGGIAANANDQTLHPTIAGAGGGGMAVWECRNARAGVNGYGRVAKPGVTAPWHCQHVLVASSPYLNFTSGGDTPTVEKATLVDMRRAVEGVATTHNVALAGGVASVVSINLYQLAKARIDAGLDPDFSTVAYDDALSWHCSTGSPAEPNQHYNHYGHEIHCQWFLDAIINAGWVS